MAAIQAGKRGRSVLVIEHSQKIGKKILISGGGRCNFTNKHAGPENYISKNPHFCKSALARFTPQDFIDLVEKHGIAYHEKKLGQLFCDGLAQEIVTLLESECREAGVEIVVKTKVEKILKGQKFEAWTDQGIFTGSSLIIATGGLSIPKMGATPFAYQIAEQYKHKIIPPRPGLVPLLWNEEDLEAYADLTGIAVDAIVTCGKKTFRENILFTHRGLSGPAILQISSYWAEGQTIAINLLPDRDLFMELKESRANKLQIFDLLCKHLPRRVAQKWTEIYTSDKSIVECSDKELEYVSQQIQEWKFVPAGTEGYDKAEVTSGGVDTAEISSKTMESNLCTGLYFVGESLDVTGQLGGYNFQWAWASGFSAGQAA